MTGSAMPAPGIVRAVARCAAVRERRRRRGRLLRRGHERWADESPNERRGCSCDVARAARESTATPRSHAIRLPGSSAPTTCSTDAFRWDRAIRTTRRVRVTVELVRMRDGSSVWADRYEAKTEDLFTVEGQIGERVAAALEVALAHASGKPFRHGRRRTSRHTPTSCEARRSASRRRTLSTTRRVPSRCSSEPSRSIRSSRSRSRDSRKRTLTSIGRTRIGRRSVSRSCAPRRRQRCASIPISPKRTSRSAYYYFWGFRDYDRALAEFSAAARRAAREQ